MHEFFFLYRESLHGSNRIEDELADLVVQASEGADDTHVLKYLAIIFLIEQSVADSERTLSHEQHLVDFTELILQALVA